MQGHLILSATAPIPVSMPNHVKHQAVMTFVLASLKSNPCWNGAGWSMLSYITEHTHIVAYAPFLFQQALVEGKPC